MSELSRTVTNGRDESRAVSAWSQSLVNALVANGDLEAKAALHALTSGAGGSAVSVLAAAGLVDTTVSLACLAAISGVRAVDIAADPPSSEARVVLPRELAQQFHAVGYRLEDGRIVLACAEPLGVAELGTLAATLDREVAECVLADPAAIDRLVGIDTDRAQVPAPEGDGALGADVAATSRPTAPIELEDLLAHAVNRGASDLHLAVGSPPAIRIDGSIRRLEALASLDNNEVRRLVFGFLPNIQRERFEATKELDTSHAVPGLGRFRVSVFQQKGSVGAVLRLIPSSIPPFDSLGLPKVVESFADLRRGLVLVTGPTGSGKSTTLASVIDIVNRSKPLHIMTVEDPIEFLHSHGASIVNQREVGQDTQSFGECLRHVLRQDPDVILVGELRDLETISSALTAAETGHLVFATLHTQDAPQTIDRIIDVFPPNQQDQVRIQLAGALEAVVTQQLVPSDTGSGRVPVAEVMICVPAIRNLIRTGKTHQVYSLMQTGAATGMQTMDQALANAVQRGLITETMALDRSRDPNQLRDYLLG